ncbi:hypothetical protein ASPZODRAFT_668752 [Penicilliopsis zonata CBS 506.65]|uniref:D-xylose reductase [NAD(P)H] n=1 Tax=Penicilliopsis zonata CBS 506.65 TaxID=1073090 RepID=A0A1L9SD48_9EURO|nr:hypothetical protein ASPZODRAFT_668752 [Penicilliopsis zonata CBS 506.65]OJJ45024.1 hypothetical protein ASPZODRAFT_668752 [Penicilliopsis zonata CBS 506.65]
MPQLHTGNSIPAIGFGCAGWGTGPDAAEDLFDKKFEAAYASGYRLYDCAEEYGPVENDIGRLTTPVREQVYLLTKCRDYRPGDTVATVLPRLQASVRRMCPGMEKPCVDLFLIHEPVIGPEGRVVMWEALVELQKLGETKDIGVSNFGLKHLLTLPAPKPVVNQVELHPWCQHREMVEYCNKNGIIMQCYAPNARNKHADNPVLQEISQSVNRSPTQVLLRWSIQHGYIPLPKSDHAERIKQNIEVFDFTLSEEQMERLDALGADGDHPVCKSYDDFCD